MKAIEGMRDAINLRRWRRDMRMTRSDASARLGISERMLAYYEAGERPAPKPVLLAAKALAAGLDEGVVEDGPDAAARARWAELVRNLLAYGGGEPVVGRMLRNRDRDGLDDFLRFVKRGPDSALALTDPALFQSLSAAVLRAHLSGLSRYRVDPAAKPVPHGAAQAQT